MKAGKFAVSSKDSWRNISITLIDPDRGPPILNECNRLIAPFDFHSVRMMRSPWDHTEGHIAGQRASGRRHGDAADCRSSANVAFEYRCSADFRNHFSASSSLAGTPSPSR
jgi:hypothetical protein